MQRWGAPDRVDHLGVLNARANRVDHHGVLNAPKEQGKVTASRPSGMDSKARTLAVQRENPLSYVLRRQLQQKDHETVNFLPMDEGKEKGLDGKACWKGYRLAGTKKKGGKTVDNCVKEEDKAFNYVVAKLRKQHGDDAVLTKGQKPKPPTAAQRKKNDAIRAKRAKEDHRDETEKATSGRYNDRSRSD